MINDYILLPTGELESNGISNSKTIDSDLIINNSFIIYVNYNNQNTNNLYSNCINTSKYTWVNAIPKILKEQFSKTINLYFILIAMLQSIREISYSGGQPVILLPLAIVVIINGIKDFYEDYKRKKSDFLENSKKAKILNNKTGTFEDSTWGEIKLGDIIMVKDNEYFPCDLLLLSSSNENNICYIETKNIDGEANLKIRHNNIKGYRDITSLRKKKLKIEIPPPNDNLYSFDAKIYKNENNYSDYFTVNNSAFLPRGCKLMHTNEIIGASVYLGNNTKCMKNAPSPRIKTKTSKVENMLNFQIILIFAMQIILSLISAGLNLVMRKNHNFTMNNYLFYSPNFVGFDSFYHNLSLSLQKFGVWILIFTNFIPISLLVSMEMIKFFQGIFISWDIDLYSKEKHRGAKVQTSTLNEELGQVTHIFTDKTGTLTKNLMIFKKCVINNVIYCNSNEENRFTFEEIDKYGKIKYNGYKDKSNKLKNKLKEINDESEEHKFLECICLCNSITVDYEEWNKYKKINYIGSSSDEVALVNFARSIGYIYKENNINDNIVTIEINEKTFKYKIISKLDYSSERKRMSVVVESLNNNNYYLFIKGDEHVLKSKMNKIEIKSKGKTFDILNDFAREGLRTLAFGYKKLNDEEVIILNSISNDNKDNVFSKIEKNIAFLGATGIEDELQNDLYQSISSLRSAGIKIWMVTGDKTETSLNIAYSSHILDKQTDLLTIPENSTPYQIEALLSTDENIENIVLSSNELNTILSSTVLTNLFSKTAFNCNTVICSRVTPKQKGQIVNLMNTYGRLLNKNITTLAIGDGANDVNMISTANIGIGIFGNEGGEACRASDYSITQFSHLNKLLFVHGRESYRKNTFVIVYNIYKNALFVLPQFFFGILSCFSGQVLYDRWIYQFYNTTFTCLPIIWFGIYDMDDFDKTKGGKPAKYYQGINNKLFSSFTFWKWITMGFGHAFLIFIFSFFFMGPSFDIWSTGTLVYSSVVLVANWKIVQYTKSHTFISTLIVFLSVFMYYLTIYMMNDYSYFYIYGNWDILSKEPKFYLSTLMVLVSVIVVDKIMKIAINLKKSRNNISFKNSQLELTKVQLIQDKEVIY